MREFEPKLKKKVFTRQFFSRYIYIFVIGLCLLLGISYGLTFFTENKNIVSGSITTGDLSITVSDRTIEASGLTVPLTDQAGLALYSKSITLENTTSINSSVKLYLSRTSGLSLTDLKCAVSVNGAIQKIIDVPSNGELLQTAILAGEETINVEVRLWPKTSYAGEETNFNGEIKADVKYLGQTASTLLSPAGKYVSFNCGEQTCETWQIVKIEDGRLVLTRQNDYEGASSRINSGKFNPASFNPALTFNDDSLITSVSTDGKNVYLAKTVSISDGSGTQNDPYILTNTSMREADKKVTAVITYKYDGTTIGTQNVYYGETNYISQTSGSPIFQYWVDNSENNYYLGDIVSFTSDINLNAFNQTPATNIEYINNTLQCSTIQCALVKIGDIIYGESE